jgi:DNA helicase-2/ATP-dependent DNA helicase PcrA
MKSSDEDDIKAERMEIIKALVKLVSEHDDLDELIEIYKKMTTEVKDGVVLTSIHGSKGLEWKHVFVVEVLEGKFPDVRTPEVDESCAFFVAITRAKDNLFINGSSIFVEKLQEILDNKPENWKEKV